MKKIARKIVGVALALPVLIGGLALPAIAADTTIVQTEATSFTAAKKAQISKAISAVRAKNTWLGAATSLVRYDPANGGAIKGYKGGSIVWSANGAFAVKTSIRNAYIRLGGDWSLRYPTSGEIKLNGGSIQHFMGGDIHWTSKGGAHQVFDVTTWKKNGGLTGRLGFPVSDFVKRYPKNDQDNTWYQKFQGGTIYSGYTGAGNPFVPLRVVFNN